MSGIPRRVDLPVLVPAPGVVAPPPIVHNPLAPATRRPLARQMGVPATPEDLALLDQILAPEAVNNRAPTP